MPLEPEAARPAAHAAVDAPRRRPPSKPPPSSRTRSSVRPTNESSTSTPRGAGVLGDVGEALLRDAEDHELLLVGERRERRRGGGSARCMPVRWPKSLTCEASAATRPWSSSAVGRSWRASASSSSIACATSSWVSCSSERSPHGASPIVAESRSRIAVSAWLTSSCRSWAIRAALLLLRAQHGAAGLAALVLEPLEHPVEGVGELVHLARRAARRRSARMPGRARSTARHRARRAAPSARAARAAAAS